MSEDGFRFPMNVQIDSWKIILEELAQLRDKKQQNVL